MRGAPVELVRCEMLQAALGFHRRFLARHSDRPGLRFQAALAHLRVGEMGQASVEDVVPFGMENGQPARLTGIFHPAGSELTIAKAADDSGVNAFGIAGGGGGKSGFSTKFAWSA